MTHDPDIILTLRWRHTWPTGGPDYSASDPESGYDGPVGRIMLDQKALQPDRWEWSMTAHLHGIQRDAKMSGIEGSAKAAARQVEAAWERGRAGTRYDRVVAAGVIAEVPPVNAYAAAKGR
jgi:hypothetical protein